LVILGITLIVIVTQVALGAWVYLHSDQIRRFIIQQAGVDIKIGRVEYAAPGYVMLTQVAAAGGDRQSGEWGFAAQQVKLAISLGKAFSLRGLNFQRCVIYNPRLVVRLSQDKGNGFAFSDAANRLKSLPAGCRIIAKGGYLQFFPAGQVEPLGVHFDGELRKTGPVSLRMKLNLGVRKPDILVGVLPAADDLGKIHCEAGITGQPACLPARQGFISIDELKIKSGHVETKLWGNLASGRLKLNGYILFDNKVSGPWSGDMNIYDLDARLVLAAAGLDIEKISFTLNGRPFSLNGYIRLARAPRFILRLAQGKDFSWSLRGLVKPCGYSGEFSLVTPVARTLLKLKNLTFARGHEPSGVLCDDLLLRLDTSGKAYHLRLSELNAGFRAAGQALFLDRLDCGIYGGRFSGNGRLDLGSWPPGFYLTGSLRQADLSLVGLDLGRQGLSGACEFDFNCANRPQPALTGRFRVYDGMLKDTPFLLWVSANFGLPSLAEFAFEELSGEVKADARVLSLRDLDFRSLDLRSHSYFNIDRQGMVSSKISLFLSRALMSRSAKFRRLLGLLDKNTGSLEFAFQLSGRYDALNFQWLDSELKSKLKNTLPGFLERMLESEVDQAIRDIKTEDHRP